MAFVDVINCCLESIRELSEELKGAVVYLDAGSTESFKFLGAFPVLLEMGVLGVCSLESMSSVDMAIDWNRKSGERTKVVFFTCRLLSDAHRYILRCLTTLERVFQCSIYISISEIGHSAYPDSPLGPDAYHEYQMLLIQDYEEVMKEKNPPVLEEPLIAFVHHFPLIVCPFSPNLFVLPSEGSMSEAYLSGEQENSISCGLPPLSSHDGDDDVPAGVPLTAHFLYHLTAKMDLKLEIFSLGDLSRSVGKLITDMSSLYNVGRRKRSAGLLLIDRTADLLTPCCHGDSLVDRIFSCLPRRTRTPSSGPKGSLMRAPLDLHIPVPGNVQLLEKIQAFLHGWDHGISSLEIEGSTENLNLESILNKRTKDATTFIKKRLEEALRKENISMQGSDFHRMIQSLAKNQSSLTRNKGIIQLASATSSAMSEKHRAKWDSFISAEKILAINAADTTQNLSSQMCDIINKFSIQDALLLTLTGYILAGENFPTSGSTGPFSWQEEHFLKEAIVDAILDSPELPKLKFLHGLYDHLEANVKKKASKDDGFEDDEWGNWGEDDGYSDLQLKLELRDRVDNLFKFFHKLTNLKGKSGGDDPYSRKGLLYKLVTAILRKEDVPGLEYHSSTVGRLFKTGFGRFGLGQAKPSLSDQNLILVFVVGGINAIEVLEVEEALFESGRVDIQVVLGGTTFLTPANMFDLLLGDSTYI